MQQFFRIAGSARLLPKKQIIADDLDRSHGLPVGWTAQHTGVQFRYEAVFPETGTSLGRQVVLDALQDASVVLSDVELIIDASLTLQQPVPSNAALIQEALGAEALGCATMDIHSSCLGFIVSLQVVNGLFASGAYKNAVIVCSETPLRGVNWNEPASAHLVGDGAAAVFLKACAPTTDCQFKLQTFSDGAALCQVLGGGHRLPAFEMTASNQEAYRFHMDGKGVHKFASRHLPDMVSQTLEDCPVPLENLHIIPHQASKPAIDLLSRRLKVDGKNFHSSIEDHGNLAAAGIPYVLHQVRQTVPPGSTVLLIGTAAGYSQAVATFTL